MLGKEIEKSFFSKKKKQNNIFKSISSVTTTKNSIQKFIYFSQRHQFDAIFFPTVGYRLKLQELTDGGDYACHSKFDQNHEFDFHFTVNIDRELNKCRGYAKSNKNVNKNAIDVTVTDATVAPIGVYKFLTTAKRKPHLITTKSTSSNCSSIVASKSMVRRTTGDGQSSIQKRHINSFDTSTVSTPSFTTTTATTSTSFIITTTPSSIPVLHSNKQHSTLSDIELSTATAEIPTTIVPIPDNWYPMILPYSMGKRYGSNLFFTKYSFCLLFLFCVFAYYFVFFASVRFCFWIFCCWLIFV